MQAKKLSLSFSKVWVQSILITLSLAGCGGVQTSTIKPTITPVAQLPTATQLPTRLSQTYIVTADSATNSSVLQVFDMKDGTQLWQFSPSTPQHINTLIVEGMQVYVGTDSNLYALDASTGSQLWNTPIGQGVLAIFPTQNTVYADSYGVIYALATTNGSERWHIKVGDAVDTLLAGDGEMVYATDGNQLDSLDAATGTSRWTFKARQDVDIYSIIPLGGLLVVETPDTLYVLRASDGSLVWQHSSLSVWLLSNGVIYAIDLYSESNPGQSEGKMSAFRLSDGRQLWEVIAPLTVPHAPTLFENGSDIITPEAIYRFTPSSDSPSAWSLSAWQTNGGKRLWEVPADAHTSDLWADNGIVYTASENKQVSAYRTSDGSLLWQKMLQGLAPNLSFAHQVLYAYDGRFNSGYVIAFNPQGTELWQHALGQQITLFLAE